MYLLGFDIGSSSVKACLLRAEDGQVMAVASSPDSEMKISSLKPGWAEQDPELWWKHLLLCTRKLRKEFRFHPSAVKSIGIAYQMHGLVCTDKNKKPLRPCIIWCDSRSVETGARAFESLGKDYCLNHLLNSPGNFTASKLAWVKKNEKSVFDKIDKVMLPGDYISMKMTGSCSTTPAGLSEGILWDYKSHSLSKKLIDHFEFDEKLFPKTIPSFGIHGVLSGAASRQLSLTPGVPIAYKSGDQPNNAFALGALNSGEWTANAGTSGVIYAVSEKAKADPLQRINSFLHVNHTSEKPRIGQLMCINGAGILNSWIKKLFTGNKMDYQEMNRLAASTKPGSDGLLAYPFGNGAERILQNNSPGASFVGLNFNRHGKAHLMRAAQEGIAFAMCFGMEMMRQNGGTCSVIKAGYANMFLSAVFREVFVNTANVPLELISTDGAQGAARGAGVGAGIYKNYQEAFIGLKKIKRIIPDKMKANIYKELFSQWKQGLKSKN